MSGVESFIPGMDGVTGVTEKYVTGDQLGVSMTSANNTYLQPTGEGAYNKHSRVLASCSETRRFLELHKSHHKSSFVKL